MPASKPVDFSMTLSGTSEELFPEAPYASVEERFVTNPNATGSIWINVFGEDAVVNGQGSIAIPALTGWSGAVSSQINVIGTAADKVTAGQRN